MDAQINNKKSIRYSTETKLQIDQAVSVKSGRIANPELLYERMLID